MVVERNDKTFDVKINALMNVWKNVPDEKNGFTKRSSHIIQYETILVQLLKVLLFMLANLSKLMNYCIYLSLLVENSDDKIYYRQIDLLGSGTIFF